MATGTEAMLVFTRRNALGIDGRDAACQDGKPDDLPHHLMPPKFHAQPGQTENTIAPTASIAKSLRIPSSFASFS
jgi:hypothetical protein